MASVMRLVTEVRRFRSDQGLRPGQRVAARLAGIEDSPLAGHGERIRFLLRLSAPDAGFTPSASIEAEGVTAELDTAGVIDVAAERRRMEKDLAAAGKEAAQVRGKLGERRVHRQGAARRGGKDPPAPRRRRAGHHPDLRPPGPPAGIALPLVPGPAGVIPLPPLVRGPPE